jgi:hypothetical protein
MASHPDYLERNLAVLARRQPVLARLISVAAQNRIELVPSRKGLPTAFYRRDGSDPVPLHSRYDPLQEARQSLKDVDLAQADYFILLGFGLGYGADALVERVAQERAHIFAVESDLEILRAAFAARDLTSLLALPNVHFPWPPEGNELAWQWQQFFDPVRAQGSIFLSHPPSLVLNPSLFKSAVEVIKSKTLQIFTDINTLVGRMPLFLKNFVTNFARASSSPGVAAFRQKFRGVPAVLVAAGPSLDRNVHELRAFHQGALILSTDTTLKPLLASGIEPHFLMSGDPGQENYLHLEGADAPSTYLVAEATAHPGAFEQFAGRTVVCTFEDSSLRAFSELLGPKGALRAWGSVATMCLDFALLAGCNPIIFVGQDLAFTEGRTYCSGLHWENKWFAGVVSPEDWQQRWANIRATSKTLLTEDLFGQPVETTDKLIAYWNWIGSEIEKHPATRFINASEGGILRNNVEIMSLREALHRCCRGNHDFGGTIRGLYDGATSAARHADTALMNKLHEECSLFRKIIEPGLTLCRSPHPIPAPELLARLEHVREELYSLKKLVPLLDNLNQMGNITFVRRQAALTAQPTTPIGAETIREIYLEYLQSFSTAYETAATALSRLSVALKEQEAPNTVSTAS